MSRFSTIRRVASTGSTNEDMARILGEDDAHGLTIVADYQTHGSGRKGRTWIAPPKSSLLFTTALPDQIASQRLWLVPFWIGLVVHRTLASFQIKTQLQWPNDILLAERKVAGILCISRVTGDSAWAAFGVGVNVQRPTADSAIAGIDPPPAFLSDERVIDRDQLLLAILREADHFYAELDSPEAIRRAWESAAAIPGAQYNLQIEGQAQPLEARAVELAQDGGLVVEDHGRRRTISLADARVLR